MDVNHSPPQHAVERVVLCVPHYLRRLPAALPITTFTHHPTTDLLTLPAAGYRLFHSFALLGLHYLYCLPPPTLRAFTFLQTTVLPPHYRARLFLLPYLAFAAFTPIDLLGRATPYHTHHTCLLPPTPTPTPPTHTTPARHYSHPPTHHLLPNGLVAGRALPAFVLPAARPPYTYRAICTTSSFAFPLAPFPPPPATPPSHYPYRPTPPLPSSCC